MFLHREQAKNMTNSQSDQGFKPKSVAYWQPTLTIDITITVLLWLTFRGDRVACDVNHRRKWQPAKNSDTVIATFAGGHSSAVKIKKKHKIWITRNQLLDLSLAFWFLSIYKYAHQIQRLLNCFRFRFQHQQKLKMTKNPKTIIWYFHTS